MMCNQVEIRWKSGCFDEHYVAALQEGDPAAQEDLMTSFRKPVRNKAQRHLRNFDLVEDACQETFLRVLRYFCAGNVLNKPERLPAFVHSVCKNVVREIGRGRARYMQIPEGHPDPVDGSVDLDRDLVAEERKRIVLELLLDLPEKDRELLRLAVFEDADRDEICRRWEANRPYLRVLLHRASQRLLEALVESRNPPPTSRSCAARPDCSPGR